MYRQIQGVRLKIKIKNLQKKRKKGRPNTCSNMCMLTNFPHNLRALRAKSSIVHPILVPMGRETVSILMHLIAPNRGGGVLSVPFLSIPSIKLCCKCQVASQSTKGFAPFCHRKNGGSLLGVCPEGYNQDLQLHGKLREVAINYLLAFRCSHVKLILLNIHRLLFFLRYRLTELSN